MGFIWGDAGGLRTGHKGSIPLLNSLQVLMDITSDIHAESKMQIIPVNHFRKITAPYIIGLPADLATICRSTLIISRSIRLIHLLRSAAALVSRHCR